MLGCNFSKHNFKSKLSLFLIVLFLPVLMMAQNRTAIKGHVQKDSGERIAGVTVRLTDDAGHLVKTVPTDANGAFSFDGLDPSRHYNVSFSDISYQPLTNSRLSPAQDSVSVTLVPVVNVLDQVVVVGYGTQRKVSVTGGVDVVKPTAIEGRPSVNMAQALQGTSPSLIIQNNSFEPGQSPSINLRGVGTLGDNSPLIVIDGLVGGDLNLLNPNDIESISILKDAGSAAIYGSRSANGVILVTTKKGKAGRAVVSYNGITSLTHPHILVKPVAGYENMLLKDQALVNSGQLPSYTPLDIEAQKARGDQPWFLDELFHDAWQQNHNLSISGGAGKTTYMMSGGLMDQQSNLYGPRKGVRRYNYRMNLSTEVGKLKVTSILAYTRNEIRDHSSSTGTLVVDAERTPPLYQYKDSLGRYLINDVLTEFNPFGVLQGQGFRRYDNDNLFGSINGELEIAKGLKLRGVFGGTLDANHMFYMTNYMPYYRVGTPAGGAAANADPGGSTTGDQNTKNVRLNSQLILQYDKKIGAHNLSVMGGYTSEAYTGKYNAVTLRYTSPDLDLPNSNTIVNVGDQRITPQSTSQNNLNSFIGRGTYSYEDRIFGEASFRADGSSKFSKNNRWGYFPSISGGWLISRENFFKNSSIGNWVSELKLRSSYGVLGNQNVGNYQYQTTYFVFSNAYGFNNTSVAGTGFNTANPDIRWETAKTFNIGADISLLKRKLNITLDAFNKRTDNILQQPTLPGTYGGSNVDFNIASVNNKGWEVSVNYNIPGRVWRHSITANLGDTRNEIVKMANGQARIQSADEMQYIYAVGLPIASYVGLKRDGYFQNLKDIQNKPRFVGLDVGVGDISYKDKNGDGIIDDNDRYILGNPFPRYTFGFNYTLGYKNLDLVVFVQGVGKRDMAIRGELVEPFHQNYSYLVFQHQLDYWTPDNTDARFPRLAVAGSASNTNNYRKGSDLYIFNGAYARLKNIQIGYSLPGSVAKMLGTQRLRVYLTGQNLLTLSKTKFLDPESTEFNSNLGAGGANSGRAYPTPLYYGFGLDVTF